MTDNTTPVPTEWLNDLYAEFKRLGDARQGMHMLQVTTIRDQLAIILGRDEATTVSLLEFAKWIDSAPSLDPAHYEPDQLVQMYQNSTLGRPSENPTPSEPPKLPHSRACGFRTHDHGPVCARDCPTCHGRAFAL